MGHSFATWDNPRLKGRITELDGIRGLAILLVLVFHYVISVIQVTDRTWQAYALVPFRLTWTGVDLFFVLSGFLIGGILYDAKNLSNYYRTFYLRRLHRIFPIYYIWIALFLVGLYVVGPHPRWPLRSLFNWDLPAWSYPLFLQNFFMTQRGLGPNWIGVTWSLAVEEQFYMLLPLLMRTLSYRGIIGLSVGAVVVAPILRVVLWFSGSYHYGPYTLLPCRADALGFGVLVAIACRNRKVWEWLASHGTHLYATVLALGCGLVFLTVRQREFFVVVGFTWIAAFYASVILLALVNPNRIVRVVFGSQLLRTLGTVAYSVYLLHQGINGLFHFAIFGRVPMIDGWSSLGVTLLALLTVLLLSAISWRLMEKPLIHHAHSHYKYGRSAEQGVTSAFAS